MAGIVDRIKSMFGMGDADKDRDGEIKVNEAELDSDSSYDRVQADIARNKQEAFDRMSDMDGSETPIVHSGRKPGNAATMSSRVTGVSATPLAEKSAISASSSAPSCARPIWIAPRGRMKGSSEKAGSGEASSGPLALVSGCTPGPP